MTTSVVVRIQGHPSRRRIWKTIVDGCDPLPTEVSVHHSHPPNPWEGYQRALLAGCDAATNPTHVLVLQDDVIVCNNFAAAVERIAAAKPDDPVCLFCSWLPQQIAKALTLAAPHQRYVQARAAKFCPVVAVLWPVHAARSFLDWSKGEKLPGYPSHVRSDDACLAHWIRRRGAVVWVTNPSLVEHPDKVPSVWGRKAAWGRDKGRVALNFIGNQDPLELDWS